MFVITLIVLVITLILFCLVAFLLLSWGVSQIEDPEEAYADYLKKLRSSTQEPPEPPS